MCEGAIVSRINEVEYGKFMNFYTDTSVEMFNTNRNYFYRNNLRDLDQIVYGNKFKW